MGNTVSETVAADNASDTSSNAPSGVAEVRPVDTSTGTVVWYDEKESPQLDTALLECKDVDAWTKDMTAWVKGMPARLRSIRTRLVQMEGPVDELRAVATNALLLDYAKGRLIHAKLLEAIYLTNLKCVQLDFPKCRGNVDLATFKLLMSLSDVFSDFLNTLDSPDTDYLDTDRKIPTSGNVGTPFAVVWKKKGPAFLYSAENALARDKDVKVVAAVMDGTTVAAVASMANRNLSDVQVALGRLETMTRQPAPASQVKLLEQQKQDANQHISDLNGLIVRLDGMAKDETYTSVNLSNWRKSATTARGSKRDELLSAIAAAETRLACLHQLANALLLMVNVDVDMRLLQRKRASADAIAKNQKRKNDIANLIKELEVRLYPIATRVGATTSIPAPAAPANNAKPAQPVRYSAGGKRKYEEVDDARPPTLSGPNHATTLAASLRQQTEQIAQTLALQQRTLSRAEQQLSAEPDQSPAMLAMLQRQASDTKAYIVVTQASQKRFDTLLKKLESVLAEFAALPQPPSSDAVAKHESTLQQLSDLAWHCKILSRWEISESRLLSQAANTAASLERTRAKMASIKESIKQVQAAFGTSLTIAAAATTTTTIPLMPSEASIGFNDKLQQQPKKSASQLTEQLERLRGQADAVEKVELPQREARIKKLEEALQQKKQPGSTSWIQILKTLDTEKVTLAERRIYVTVLRQAIERLRAQIAVESFKGVKAPIVANDVLRSWQQQQPSAQRSKDPAVALEQDKWVRQELERATAQQVERVKRIKTSLGASQWPGVQGGNGQTVAAPSSVQRILDNSVLHQ